MPKITMLFSGLAVQGDDGFLTGSDMTQRPLDVLACGALIDTQFSLLVHAGLPPERRRADSSLNQ
jgi:hypothetical protein